MTKLARIETVIFLQSADLFAFCRAEEILRISAIAHERHFDAGETVYDVNDPATALYCVVRGEVTLEGAGDPSLRIGPLGAFGVLEILSGRLRSARATAKTETLALQIDADDFFDLLANNIEIVKALFRRLLDGEGQRAATY